MQKFLPSWKTLNLENVIVANESIKLKFHLVGSEKTKIN